MATTPHEVNQLLDEQDRLEDDLAPISDEAALRRRVIRQVRKRRDFRTHLTVFLVMNLIFFVFFSVLAIPWVSGVIALAWGSGLAAQGVDVYFDTGKRAAARLARLHQAFRDAYGPRWAEEATRAQLVAVRQETEAPYRKRAGLYQHAVVYLVINLMLWFIYFSIMPGSVPWPLLVTGLWGVGLAANAVDTFAGKRQDESLEREVERQRALIEEAQWGSEKPKNDFLEADEQPGLTVGPDGELIEIAEPPDEQSKQKRG